MKELIVGDHIRSQIYSINKTPLVTKKAIKFFITSIEEPALYVCITSY